MGDYGFGQDPIISACDSWSPNGADGGIFGDRDDAEDQTKAGALRDATGKGVNVIIVDRGLDRNWINDTKVRMAARRNLRSSDPASTVLGWTRYRWTGRYSNARFLPGASGSPHGHMIARNVLAIAPEANIWDAPLLPSADEQDAPPTPSRAAALFRRIKDATERGTVTSWDPQKECMIDVAALSRPVIIVNAWGVLDPESDPSYRGYADDPDDTLIAEMSGVDAAGIDVVFAAGNCGESCPDKRCGRQDTGPGRSILGLNAHPDVLTVGAVRVDGLPIALSAQGPGRLATVGSKGTDYSENLRAIEKPDLCAPSHFRESDDAYETNTGTSASCGFTAGILAALRSLPSGKNLQPEKLRELLRRTARRPTRANNWDPRLGFGVIDAEAALARLASGWG